MAPPVFGVASLDALWTYPDTVAPITRGGSDNFAIGGGMGDLTGQTAAYGADGATLAGAEVALGGFIGRLFTRASPASGLQNWTLTGGGTGFGPAVMTFSGVNLVAPVRGYTTLALSGASSPVVLTLPVLTAHEIAVAYVAWSNGSITLGATGTTTIRAQGQNGAGFGGALVTSTSRDITLTRSAATDIRVLGLILAGTVGGAGTSAFGRFRRRR